MIIFQSADYFPIRWLFSSQFRVAGGQSPRSSWVKGRHQTWTGRPSITEGTHAHAHTLSLGPLDTPNHLRAHTFPWDVERNWNSPEKTHIDMERMYELHTDTGPCWESIFFSHWRYNKTIPNETTLFENLHYVAKIKGRKEGSSPMLNGCWQPTPYYSLQKQEK